MIELITNIDAQLIHVLADRCNDQYFKDFNRETYEEALYRADRTVARKYQVLTRMLKFTATIETPPESLGDDDYMANEKNTDIPLSILTLHQEYKVLVNEVPYIKGKQNALVDNAVIADSYTYYLYYGHNSWLFNYNPRTANDDIIIFYMSGAGLDNFDADANKPIIPDKYEDERIRHALVNIATMGITKFKEEKREKYMIVLRANGKREMSNLDPNLLESKASLTIQPFKYP